MTVAICLYAKWRRSLGTSVSVLAVKLQWVFSCMLQLYIQTTWSLVAEITHTKYSFICAHIQHSFKGKWFTSFVLFSAEVHNLLAQSLILIRLHILLGCRSNSRSLIQEYELFYKDENVSGCSLRVWVEKSSTSECPVLAADLSLHPQKKVEPLP